MEFIPFEQNTPSFQEYSAEMAKTGKFATGQVPYVGWLSADAFVEGIKAAGVNCPTQEAFINNLRLDDDYDANGAITPIDFRKIYGRPFTACTTCTWRTSRSNRSSTASRSARPGSSPTAR